ncbi:DUF4244 domain-containing protein [Zhihengliuella sp.]|uniref:DUF4244 domain-containing protein n=1 Tax=Zhihengliuella sp. TaxID=1954483 RepID=UPI0028111789|nr:DUF4244 domain-containing protein [Zhihengliuella sp.]
MQHATAAAPTEENAEIVDLAQFQEPGGTEELTFAGPEWAGEHGIATAEFAIVALAAVAFAGVLVTVLSSGDVSELLMGLVQKALSY